MKLDASLSLATRHGLQALADLGLRNAFQPRPPDQYLQVLDQTLESEGGRS